MNHFPKIPVHNKSLFVYQDQEAAFQICCSKQSPQQVLFNFYNIFELTGIKGSAIMQFSYTFLGFHNNG